jgi:prevent-host-death family protein
MERNVPGISAHPLAVPQRLTLPGGWCQHTQGYALNRPFLDTVPQDVHYDEHQCTGGIMRDATFTELRNHAKDYFDAVEGGDTVRVFRNGKPIAEIVPIHSGTPSWKRKAAPLTLKGVSLSREILSDRDESA